MDLALRRLVGEPIGREEALAMEGTGWAGDLAEFVPARDPSLILVDSSAWIEFLRGTGSPPHLRLRAALEQEAELASTDVVVMEILAGARGEADRDRLRRLLFGVEFLAVEGPADYERAAELYRLCRSRGETPRTSPTA